MSLESFISENRDRLGIESTPGLNRIKAFSDKQANNRANIASAPYTISPIALSSLNILAEAPKEKKTFWKWVSKQLMKPVGAVAAETEALGKFIGRVATPQYDKTIKELGVNVVGADRYIPFKEGGKVIMGKEETSFSKIWTDIAERSGVPQSEMKYIAMAGLVQDIAADPLNFLGGGLTRFGKDAQKVTSLSKVGKTIKATSTIGKRIAKSGYSVDDLILASTKAQQAAKGQRAVLSVMGKPIIPGVSYYRATSKVKDAVGATKLVSSVKGIVSTKSGIKDLDEVIDTYKNLSTYRKQQVLDTALELQKDIRKLSPVEVKMVAEAIENPAVRETIKNKLVVNIANKMDDMFKQMAVTEKATGVLGTELANYFPHIKAKQSLGKRITGLFSPKVYNANLGAAKGRTITGTVAEINAKFGKEFFQSNPAVAYAQRGIASSKAVSAKEFLEEVGKRFFINAEDAPLAYAKSTNPIFKGLKAPGEVVEAVDKYITGIQPQELKVIVKTFDEVQNWWKGQALISPSYHVRNMVGNFWNNWLAGLNDPSMYAQAKRLQGKNYSKLQFITDAGEEISGAVIRKEGLKRGIAGRGLYGAEIATKLGDEIGGITKTKRALTKLNIFKQENVLFKTNRAIGSAIEDNARWALFIDQVKKGFNYDDAARTVKKFLFDYGDLTKAEQTIFKRAVPFYTWTRKNIPVQVENLLLQPAKYAEIPKAIQAIESGVPEPESEKYMSEYISENIPVRIRRTEDGNTEYFLLGNWLPSAQAVDFLSRPLENIVNMVSPLIKTPFETIANKSFFFKNTLGEPSKIEYYYKQPTEFIGIPMRKKTANLMRNIRILNDINKFTQTPAADEPQNSLLVKIANVLFGKAATYNVQSSRYFYDRDTQERISELKAAIKRAQKNGNEGLAKSLSDELNLFTKKRKSN